MKKFFLGLFAAVVASFSLITSFAFAEGNIAKVGSTEYATFEEAVTAAAGATPIVMLADYSGTYQMTPGQTLIVDKTSGKFNTPSVSGENIVKYSNSGKVYTYTTAPATVEITKADGTISYSDRIGTVSKNNSYRLLADLEVGRTSFGGTLTKDLGTITFDLGGHTLTNTNTDTSLGAFIFHSKVETAELIMKNGKISVPNECYSVFTINAGQTVTLSSDLTVEAKGDIVAIFGENAKLNTSANLSTTGTYGIVGNGSSENFGTIINITGGSVKSGEYAVYHPQDGKITITDGELEAERAAIEIRAGELNISGGKFTATSESPDIVKNSNGPTTTGAALAIAQHTTKLQLSVTISGGEFSGYYAVYEKNIEENPAEDIAKVSASITDGTFRSTSATRSPIESYDLTRFITGGLFSLSTPSNLVPDGYVFVENGDYYEAVRAVEPSGLDALRESLGLTDIFMITDLQSELTDGQADSLASSTFAGRKLSSSLVSIYLVGIESDGSLQFIRDTGDNTITLKLQVPSDLPALPENHFRKFSVLGFHEIEGSDDFTITEHPVTFTEEGGIAYYSFTTTGFSTFGLVYEDVALPKAPDTGAPDCSSVMTENGLGTCLEAQLPVTLGGDVELSKAFVIKAGYTLSIDMNGHSIFRRGNSVAFEVRKGSLILDGTGTVERIGVDPGNSRATIRINGESTIQTEPSSVLTIGENVTIKNNDNSGIYVEDNDNMSIYGVVINLSGTINATDGIEVSRAYTSTDGPLINIENGAKITAMRHAILAAGFANWNIRGATLTGNTGIALTGGRFFIDGASVAATGPDNSALYPNSITAMPLSGAAIQLEQNLAYADDSSFYIRSGSFTSQNGYVIAEYAGDEASKNSSIKDFKIYSGELHGSESISGDSVVTSTTGAFFWYHGDGRMMEAGSYGLEDNPDNYDPHNMTIVRYANYINGFESIYADERYDYIEELFPVYLPLPDIDDFEKEALEDSEYKNAHIVNAADIRLFMFEKDYGPVIMEPNTSKPYTIPTDTGEDHPITFDMPFPEIDGMKDGYYREYFVLNFHQTDLSTGSYDIEKLPIIFGDDGKSYIFSTHKFSTFALAYEEHEIPSVPDTSVASVFYSPISVKLSF